MEVVCSKALVVLEFSSRRGIPRQDKVLQILAFKAISTA